MHVEDLRIAGVAGSFAFGLRLSGQDLVVRNLVFETDNGINASSHTNRRFYICDNKLTGPTTWPVVAVGPNVNEKNWIGIEIRGQGHTVCHNTLSNFGSTILIGYSGQSSPSPNLAIDFHNNDVVRSADDGFELDGAMRNVRAWENRVQSALMGISFQPVWGGPIYAFRNLVYNTAAAPFKLNNDPSGVILYHNTALRYAETDIYGPYDGNGWPQLGEAASYAANTRIMNNIVIGNDDPLFIRQAMPHLELDYNGYAPNGSFGLQVGGIQKSYGDLDAFSADTGFETHGVALTAPVFANAPPVSADYRILFDLDDFTLHSQSNAIDRGVVLPNVNDGFSGVAPDLGATEFGAQLPVYGVRLIDTMPPAAPVALQVTVP